MIEPLSVTALGSCRVVNPMRLATQNGQARLCNGDVYGYVHTAREVLQLLDIRDGLELPDGLVPYLAGSRALPFPARDLRAAASAPGAYLVEISSLKTVVLGEWVLQLNYFAERFRTAPEVLRTFLAAALPEQRDGRAAELARLPAYHALAPFDRHVLAEAFILATTRQDLERDVLAIAGRLARPTVFVTHCNIPDARGLEIESRARIADWLQEIGVRHGLPVYDPTLRVLAFGITAAMAEGGESRAHYTPEFEAVLTEDLLWALCRAAEAGPAPETRAAPPVPQPRTPPLPEASAGSTRAGAAALLQVGDLSGAAALARAAIAAEPAGGAGLAVLAQIAMRRGDPAAALDFAGQARAAAPSDSAAIAVAAKALTKLKRFEEAAAAWRDMAACRPAAGWALVEAARCLLRARQPEGSLALAEAVLAREPGDPVALAVKAEALRMLGRLESLPAVAEALAATTPEAALAVMQWIIAAGRGDGLARIARTVCAAPGGVPEPYRDDVCRQLRAAAEHTLAQQEWETGAEALRALLAFAPGDREAARALSRLKSRWLAPARSALQAGDVAGAAEAYERALRIDPDEIRTLREAASAAEKCGAWDRAVDLWRQVDRAGGADSSTLARGARAAELAGREEQALAWFRRALDADPGNAKARASTASLARRLAKRARALEAEGEVDEALRLAGIVLAADPQDAVCTRLVRRGGAHLAGQLRQAVALGDAGRQEVLATRLLALDPQRFDALRVLSKARLADGRFGEAADLLRRLTAVQSDVAAHWIKLGRCLRMMKSYDAARDAAEEALRRDPHSPAAHKILADLGERRAS
ncbi:tetratricopeptide repeat protein [Methylobacterium indicum]|uniref:tetratricopeptide repeat protein n=1 Tax=Methylobacterium indicum TaxID=1775910 RepID=UPI00243542A4|nr:tetratricopeptide repeat protein [Methylobacterium indicum]